MTSDDITPTSATSADARRAPWLAWGVLLVAVAVTLGVRLRVVDVALERDEGEYAYIAQLMLRGVPPYAEAYTMKLPGTPAMYALSFLVFGETIRAVHLALAAVNLAGVGLLFRLVRRWHDPLTAASAGAIYALWSLTPGVQGTSAHAEHFAVAFGLAGYLWLLRALEAPASSSARRVLALLSAGVLLGLAVTMKQQAALFVAPAALYALLARGGAEGDSHGAGRSAANLGWLALGIAAPLAALLAALAWWGVFPEFWFWTVTYAREYGQGSSNHVANALRMARDNVLGASLVMDGFALAGVASLAWDAQSRRGWMFGLCLLVGGVAATLPSLRFYEHYFVFLLPAAALYAALGLAAAARLIAVAGRTQRSSWLQAALVLIVVGTTCWEQRGPWFRHNLVAVSRTLYGSNPFPELVTVARFLNQQAQPGDRVVVLGSEPEIYFYTGLPAATKYLYTYPLFEPQPYAEQMQREMIEQIETARPEFCVEMNSFKSWLLLPGAPDEIVRWWTQCRQQHYERIGVVDILALGQVAYVWGEHADQYRPRSRVWIGVYRRRDLAERPVAQ